MKNRNNIDIFDDYKLSKGGNKGERLTRLQRRNIKAARSIRKDKTRFYSDLYAQEDK